MFRLALSMGAGHVALCIFRLALATVAGHAVLCIFRLALSTGAGARSLRCCTEKSVRNQGCEVRLAVLDCEQFHPQTCPHRTVLYNYTIVVPPSVQHCILPVHYCSRFTGKILERVRVNGTLRYLSIT